MIINVDGVNREATPEEEASILAQQAMVGQEPYRPPTPVLHCVALLDFNDFDLEGVENGAGMSAAFMIDTGKLWVFFETNMPNVSYPWNVSSSIGKANVTDRQVDYIEITVTDDAGAPVTAASVSVQIFKVN